MIGISEGLPIIHTTVRLKNSNIVSGHPETFIREYCTIHDSILESGCEIYERVSIKKSKIGKETVINTGNYVEFSQLGNNVLVGPNCSIVGVFHQIKKDGYGVEKQDSFNRVVIEDGAFIGACSVILPGVKIGKGTVIGAGTVVTHNIPPLHICFGTPPNQTIENLKKWLNRDK
ncbi:MAG: acyltransferase [Patescibacteria group bacterium]